MANYTFSIGDQVIGYNTSFKSSVPSLSLAWKSRAVLEMDGRKVVLCAPSGMVAVRNTIGGYYIDMTIPVDNIVCLDFDRNGEPHVVKRGSLRWRDFTPYYGQLLATYGDRFIAARCYVSSGRTAGKDFLLRLKTDYQYRVTLEEVKDPPADDGSMLQSLYGMEP